MSEERNDLWEQCVDFHGHACPGLAIGYKACEEARARLGFESARDEELVCVTETDACGVDAIQYLTGCTMGKGNLIYRPVGKHAYSFFRRPAERASGVRLILNSRANWPEEREELLEWLLAADAGKLFACRTPHYTPPEEAQIFNTVVCEDCGEGAAEYAVRLREGRKLCPDCAPGYTRGWEGELPHGS